MTVRHVTVLANPLARHGAGHEVARIALDALRARGVRAQLTVGDNSEHAAELAAHAVTSGTDAVAVVGGDGSIRLTLEAVYGSGVPIGVIPAGTGNDVARNLGIPLDDPVAAANLIADGHTTTVDLGRVSFPDGDTSLFITVAATGFDASVTERALAMNWPRGQSRYTLAALREIVGLRSRHYSARIGSETLEGDHAFAAIGNTSSYGGGMQITPRASMTDGLLDITMAARPTRLPRLTFARVFPKVFSGKHIDHPLVTYRQAREIELYSDPPALVSLDGDIVGRLPAVFEVIDGAVDFFTPA